MNKEMNDKLIRLSQLVEAAHKLNAWPLPPFSYDKLRRSIEEETKSTMVELAEFGISNFE